MSETKPETPVVKAKVFTPPQLIIQDRRRLSIFLAGTIDMGQSENWQKKFIDKYSNIPIDIYNPRRTNWDSAIKQDYEDPAFYQQVNWELDALEKADVIVMNFLHESKSPISLMEFGMFSKSGKMFVCSPKEFYRSGNIYIACNRYNVPIFATMNDLMYAVENSHHYDKIFTNK